MLPTFVQVHSNSMHLALPPPPAAPPTGIGELIAICLEHHHGMSREEGRRHCYFMDSKARPVLVLLYGCGACRAPLQPCVLLLVQRSTSTG